MAKPRLILLGLVEKGSYTYRARQIAPYVNALGVETLCLVGGHDCRLTRPGDIVVFVKFFHEALANMLKARRCKIVFDLIDVLVSFQFRRMTLPKDVDGIIFPNSQLMKDKENEMAPSMWRKVIHHHADPRIHKTDFSHFKLGYYGDVSDKTLSKFNRWNKNDGIGLEVYHTKDTGGWINHLKECSCHFSFRQLVGSRSSVKKPSTKVVVAAASGANIVATKDAAFLDLLDPSYPFYIPAPTEVDMLRTVNKARASYGSKEWKRGLDMMRQVNQKTTPEKIAQDFVNMVEDLS